MRDLALHLAGALAIVVALAHGGIGELYIFPNTRIEPRGRRRLLRLIWLASTVDWIAIGALLFAAPWFGSTAARQSVVAAAVIVYACAAVGNASAVRGLHPGWILMGAVVALSLAGL